MASQPSPDLIACHDCDLLHHIQSLQDGETARCRRCGAVLYQQKRNSLDRTLALTLTGIILYVVANTYPFLSFALEGRVQHNTLLTGVIELGAGGMWGLAALVFFASILAPVLKLLGMLCVLFPLKLQRRSWSVARSYRLTELLQPWSMLEVYMLGVLVALIKLSQMATIVLGTAFYAFAALIVVTTAAGGTLDPRLIWEHEEGNR